MNGVQDQASPEEVLRAHETIQDLRAEFDLTNDQIAQKIGYSTSSLYRLSPNSRKQNTVSVQLTRRIFRLAEQLGVGEDGQGPGDTPEVPPSRAGLTTLDRLQDIRDALLKTERVIQTAIQDPGTRELLRPGLREMKAEVRGLADQLSLD